MAPQEDQDQTASLKKSPSKVRPRSQTKANRRKVRAITLADRAGRLLEPRRYTLDEKWAGISPRKHRYFLNGCGAFGSMDGVQLVQADDHDALKAEVTRLREEIEQQDKQWSVQMDRLREENARLHALLAPADKCGKCAGPYRYDTSVPSVLWNRVVRAKGGSEYLCASCVLEAFAAAGVGFAAELYGGGFHGLPIAVAIDSEDAQVAKQIQDENNQLRFELREQIEENARLKADVVCACGHHRDAHILSLVRQEPKTRWDCNHCACEEFHRVEAPSA